MNAFDFADQPRNDPNQLSSKDISSSDLTRRAFSFRSNRAGSDRSSTSSSKDKPNPDQGQQYPFNEVTPIVSNPESPGRQYQSTDNSKNQQSGQTNGQSKNPTQQNSGNPGDQRPGFNSSVEHQASWYNRVIDKFGSVELDNKGSVARDHLALERTFLAWLRTSLAFASIGIAVTQLFRLSGSGGTGAVDSVNPSSFPPLLSASVLNPTVSASASMSSHLRGIGKPLGTTFIGIAILVLLVGFHRYFESQYWIIRGKFPASRGSVALIAFVTAALIVSALVVILSVAPNTHET